jgi:putative copper export protein
MDRDDLTLISILVHVPFITAWIGLVMFDAFAAFAPGIDEAQRPRLIQWSQKFTLLAIVVIMITGIWQTMENPFVKVNSYSDLNLLKERTLYGDLLFWKHVGVVSTFALSLFNRFYLAPRANSGMVASGNGTVAIIGTPAAALLKPAVLLNMGAALFTLLVASRMIMELH